jgi:hypothetical protein
VSSRLKWQDAHICASHAMSAAFAHPSKTPRGWPPMGPPPVPTPRTPQRDRPPVPRRALAAARACEVGSARRIRVSGGPVHHRPRRSVRGVATVGSCPGRRPPSTPGCSSTAPYGSYVPFRRLERPHHVRPHWRRPSDCHQNSRNDPPPSHAPVGAVCGIRAAASRCCLGCRRSGYPHRVREVPVDGASRGASAPPR